LRTTIFPRGQPSEPADVEHPMTQPAIFADGISKRFGRTLALDNVSLEVGENSFFALLGPNGAGKTTLVNILCTILRPDAGRARVRGVDLVRSPLEARRHLGIVFQDPSLDDRLSVRENLDLHGLVFGIPARLRRARIDEMLALVELADWADRPARTLSSGMKRRLEIARALIHDASILLLDEPTVGLDVQTRERVWDHVRRLQRERNLTVVVTTHYLEEVEASDHLCIMDQGRILAEGAPGALRARYGQTLLRVAPKPAEAEALQAAFADRVIRADGAEVLLRSDDSFAEAFLAAWGGRIRAVSVEVSSLASVFMSLTGRDLRDRGASGTDLTRAFGRQGGEHTR
jgi:ABC-2 type transport system ATP-binding protein